MSTEKENYKELYKKEFCKRFNAALDKLGIPPKREGRGSYVSEMFLITPRGAAKWVSGTVLPPKQKRKEIAERLKVDFEWLEFGKESTKSIENTPKKENKKSLPVLTFSEAVNYPKVLENFKGHYLEIDSDVNESGFLIYNTGTAMGGGFPEGTILIFDPEIEIKNGDYVLAKIQSLPHSIFRQLFTTKTGDQLLAQDPKYKTHVLQPEDRLIAKLIQARMNY